MSTPLGHGFCGILVGSLCTLRRPLISPGWDLAFFALAAQAPDFDFLPGLLAGQADLYHHGISHSLGFAVLCGGLCAALGAWRGGWREGGRCGLVGGAIYFAQVLLDYAGADFVPPYGVPLWWPLDGAYHILTPSWFSDIQRWPWTWAKVWHNLRAAGWETLVLGLPGLLVVLYKRQRNFFAARREN